VDQRVHAASTTARRLWDFHGGLHLPDHKAESTGTPVRRAALPARLWLPLVVKASQDPRGGAH
jgi:Na+-translocating ferredoxin:NAD+ oxidoreductase RnfC subunit